VSEPGSAGPRGRRPGRPRSARADGAIRVATLQVLLDAGYAQLSIERVASVAGVAKTTIYRRFGSKAELVGDALRAVTVEPPDPDTGSFDADVREALAQEFDEESVRRGGVLLPRLLSESADDPQLRAVVHEVLIEPRRRNARKAVQRGIDRGEIRPGLDPDDVIDALVGPVINRMLVSGGDWDQVAGMPGRIIDLVMSGIAASGAT
jgi:AcrR family transcriptional regulator